MPSSMVGSDEGEDRSRLTAPASRCHHAPVDVFTDLVAEAVAHPISGWDFSWLAGRLRWSDPPWSYDEIVSALATESTSLLDLGTGGGEWLAALEGRPTRTVALEGFPPNIPVARTRLEPLGIAVIPYHSPGDNVAQTANEPRLPFPDSSFDLIVNRHESFVAEEVHRVLQPGGMFVTEQVGSCNSLRELLGASVDGPAPISWDLAEATRQVHSAGLIPEEGMEATIRIEVDDVGALVWYLRAAPWEIPDFTIDRYGSRLRALHRICSRDHMNFFQERFLLTARRPRA